MVSITSLLLSYALWPWAQLSADVVQIKAAQATQARGLRTAELREMVVARTRTAPGELDELRDLRTQGLSRAAENAQALPSEAAQAQVLQQIEEQLASQEQELVVYQLNKNLALRRKSVVDFVNRRARHEDTDLRPVEKLAAENALGLSQKWSLEQSSTLIQKHGESAHLIPHVDRLAVLSGQREYSADMEAIKFGLIPERILASDFRLSVEPGPDQSSVRLVGRAAGAGDAPPQFAAILDRDSGYLMTRFTQFDDSGAPVMDFVASDFRSVGSVKVPFRTVLTFPGRGMADYYVQTRTVEDVKPNVEVDDASFEVPADFRVQDLRSAERVAAGPSNAQGAGVSGTDEASHVSDEAKQAERTQGSGAAPGAGQAERDARPVQKSADEETSKRPVAEGADGEDEWERYTREFIARFKLDDGQGNTAWTILRDCQERRDQYLASQRERILQLQDRLSAKKPDETGEKLLRRLEATVREMEKLKRPIEEIFEKQLKPRLDKLPTRAQRSAAEAEPSTRP